LGTYVLNTDLRNPALLAAEMATLHTLSQGRAVVGLGAGWMRADYDEAGRELPPGGPRLDRLRTAVTRTREILAAAATIDGTPAPPLMLGGGRQRMLELAGREADIVSVLPPLGPDGPTGYTTMLDDTVDGQLAWVHAAAAGRDVPPRLNHLLWGCFVTDRAAAVTDALAGRWGCAPQIVPRLVPYLIGTADQIAQELLARRQRWGFSVVTVPASAAASFAPVMRLLEH
jgi:alkanesulfonate monooxygenase SsuD/methylene tetrahydromethanopterin reductase-like flavin-dependent oxidoreductase (luciferase family)